MYVKKTPPIVLSKKIFFRVLKTFEIYLCNDLVDGSDMSGLLLFVAGSSPQISKGSHNSSGTGSRHTLIIADTFLWLVHQGRVSIPLVVLAGSPQNDDAEQHYTEQHVPVGRVYPDVVPVFETIR